jgi:hypothetical protein
MVHPLFLLLSFIKYLIFMAVFTGKIASKTAYCRCAFRRTYIMTDLNLPALPSGREYVNFIMLIKFLNTQHIFGATRCAF